VRFFAIAIARVNSQVALSCALDEAAAGFYAAKEFVRLSDPAWPKHMSSGIHSTA